MFLFIRCELGRIDDDATFASAQRDIDNGAFPGHPHGEGAHRINGLIWVETNSALVGAARIIMLDAKANEHLKIASIHPHRDTKREFTSGPPQHFSNTRIKIP